METVTLILPLEATTVNNPTNSRSDIGVTAGATAGVTAAAAEKPRSDSGLITEQ